MCGWGQSWCHQHGNRSKRLHRAELGGSCWCDLFDFVTELSRSGCNNRGPGAHPVGGGPCGRRVQLLCVLDCGPLASLSFLQSHTVRRFWFHRHRKRYRVFLEDESWGKQSYILWLCLWLTPSSSCLGASVRATFHLVEWFRCMLIEEIVQPWNFDVESTS